MGETFLLVCKQNRERNEIAIFRVLGELDKLAPLVHPCIKINIERNRQLSLVLLLNDVGKSR